MPVLGISPAKKPITASGSASRGIAGSAFSARNGRPGQSGWRSRKARASSQVPKPAHLAARGGCWFEAAELKIHLGVDAEFRPARKAHPALLVDDLDVLVESLRAAGVPVTDDDPLDGYERVYVDDPFGNRIELMEPAIVG